jgi:hypothetical protein
VNAQSVKHPWDFPEWHGLAREAAMASSLICSGVNSLGRADYTQLGLYPLAFFGLSNGIERLGKLIYTAEKLRTQGRLATDAELREFGHGVDKIVTEVRAIEKATAIPGRTFAYPDDRLTDAIIAELTAFADASKGRYANYLTVTAIPAPNDPVANWWSNVVETLLDRHFRGTGREKKAHARAAYLDSVIGAHSVVLHVDEGAGVIQSPYTMHMRSAEAEIAQKYGRLYVLRLVRWMSDVLARITHVGAYGDGIGALLGHEEYFTTFRVDDETLRNRKSWPLS